MNPGDALTVAAGVLSLQRSQWYSIARIRKLQADRLRRMLEHACERVPHYRRQRFGRLPDDPAGWLARFPVLTKRDLQAAGPALLADGTDPRTLQTSRTSGSTGEPTVSSFDRRSWLHAKYAVKMRRMLNCGVGPGARVLIVSEGDDAELARQRGARLPGAGWLFRQDYVSLRAPIERQLQLLTELKPDAIYAFPSWFAELLDGCDRAGTELPSVKVVFTSSEILPPALRNALQQRFRARVCDVYGCTEFKEVAWQCVAGTYHVNHESAWVESSDGTVDEPAGTLLLTTLINRAAPLIRYRVGDLGRLEWLRCVCGREGPTLSAIDGREAEVLELPDGRRVSPYLLTTAVEDVAGLRQYQFVQTAAAALEMCCVTDGRQVVDGAALASRLRAVLGSSIHVNVRTVDAIARSRGGKRSVLLRAPVVPGVT